MHTETTPQSSGDWERDEALLRICAVQRHGRLIRDRNGDLWCVYEGTRARDREAGERSLIFESQSAVRVVRVFPAEWRQLSDDELSTLSMHEW